MYGKISKMQMSSLQLNKFNIWLVEVKQSYISISSGHLNPSSAGYHTEKTHSLLSCNLAFWLDLEKPPKTTKNLCIHHHLDCIVRHFEPSFINWNTFFNTASPSYQQWWRRIWRTRCTIEPNHLKIPSLWSIKAICFSTILPIHHCIISLLHHW